MTVKPPTEHHLDFFLSLKGGCTGSSESSLVKMPHCWKSHATAQIYIPLFVLYKNKNYMEPRHEISNNVVSATSKCACAQSDQSLC